MHGRLLRERSSPSLSPAGVPISSVVPSRVPETPPSTSAAVPLERSPLLDRYRRLGVRLGARPEAPDFPSPLGFGDIPAEYAAAREGCALFDQTDRGLLVVGGDDAGAFLHRILSNHVLGLPVGRGNRNLLLSPKGKVLFDFDLSVEEGCFRLSTPPARSAPLREAIDRYLFQEQVTLTVDDSLFAPLEIVGPTSLNVLSALLGERPRIDPWERRSLAGIAITAKPVLGSEGFRLEVPPQHVPALWERLAAAGARPAGLVARDALRVENGVALYGADVDENVYPQEARLEAAFALDKGCYVGQEVVAKIDTYGGLNKRLTGLRVTHDDPVPSGTRLLREEAGELRDLGVVTTWAYSFALDGGAILAYVKRRHQDPGTEFVLSEDRGRASIVPFPLRR